MSIVQFPFKVFAPAGTSLPKFTAVVRVPVEDEADSAAILSYIRSAQLKSDFMNGWARQNAPSYGISVTGGPRPVFNDPEDRSSGVEAYEQEFRLTRTV